MPEPEIGGPPRAGVAIPSTVPKQGTLSTLAEAAEMYYDHPMRQPTAIDGRFLIRAETFRSAYSACALPALTLLLTSP